MMTGFLGGMMSAFIEPIRIGLQESVRKVTVRVVWDEIGRPNQSIEVVAVPDRPVAAREGDDAGRRRRRRPAGAARARKPPRRARRPAASAAVADPRLHGRPRR